jgi:plasmid stabilization system protein ParE
MRIILSTRVEVELEHHFARGVEKFGQFVAERTFQRVRRFLFEVLAEHPRIGSYRPKHDVYEAFITRTPFVVFYRFDAVANALTVVAFFHHAQDRDAEWGER